MAVVIAAVGFLRKHYDAESKGSKHRVNALLCKRAVNIIASHLDRNIVETDFLCMCIV